jgi:hypothetical protein
MTNGIFIYFTLMIQIIKEDLIVKRAISLSHQRKTLNKSVLQQ